MRIVLWGVLLTLCTMVSNASAEKGKFVLHFSAARTKPTSAACYEGGQGIVTSSTVGATGTLYLLALDWNVQEGLSELSFGLEFPSTIQLTNWTYLSEYDFPFGENWPLSGDGMRVGWNHHCVHSANPADPEAPDNGFVVMGYLDLTSTGIGYVAMTPNFDIDVVGGELYWRTCNQVYHFMTSDRLGRFDVGGPGINPCSLDQPIPVIGSTWSGLKANYR